MIMPACKHNVSFNNQVLKGEMHTENDPWRERKKKYNSEIKILFFFVVVLNITFQCGRYINEETFLDRSHAVIQQYDKLISHTMYVCTGLKLGPDSRKK